MKKCLILTAALLLSAQASQAASSDPQNEARTPQRPTAQDQWIVEQMAAQFMKASQQGVANTKAIAENSSATTGLKPRSSQDPELDALSTQGIQLHKEKDKLMATYRALARKQMELPAAAEDANILPAELEAANASVTIGNVVPLEDR